MKGYAEFVESKRVRAPSVGLAPGEMHPSLSEWQSPVTSWALRKGRAALFEDCGLGKTRQGLAWAAHIPGDVLVLTPLAVAEQWESEGVKAGIHCAVSRDGSKRGQITVTNYQQMHRFDLASFTGIILDESSILKAHDGKTRTAIIDGARPIPYRLALTATPAPNDHMELANHAEFLGVMTRGEMLARFFVHDGGDTSSWRLKGHAVADFWGWVATWAMMIRTPADIGYDATGYVLPPMRTHEHIIASGIMSEGQLFALPALSLNDQRRARKRTVSSRVDNVAVTIKTEWDKLAADGVVAGAENPSRTEEVHAGVLRVTSGEVQANAGAAKEVQRESTRRVRKGRDAQESNQGGSGGVAAVESGEAKGAAAPELRHVDRGIQVDAGESKLVVCDLWDGGHVESEHLSAGGSLPQDRSGARVALSVVQPRDREVQGQPRDDEGRGRIPRSQWIIWCELNSEQDEFESAFGDLAYSVRGSDDEDARADAIAGWLRGDRPVIISKPSILGWGMNFQQCSNMAFVGLSHSWEQFYQSVRRCWRFGQASPVDVHVFSTDVEIAVLESIKAKQAAADEMAAQMVGYMRATMMDELSGGDAAVETIQTGAVVSGDGWTMHHGDCVDVVSRMPSESIGYSIFSPPFASLYTYTDDLRDMGNTTDGDEFARHFMYLLPELYRVTKPGRLVSFHCMNLPTSKTRDGVIGLRDFRGELIEMFCRAGWIFHSEVCIWKDPVTAMQRTKALGLLHKQVQKDSCMSRQGLPDYMVTMRKPGVNIGPVGGMFEDFVGDEPRAVFEDRCRKAWASTDGRMTLAEFISVNIWQRYASPVWMDINPSDTLQYRSARDQPDERHICPLQLQVIERGCEMWSNPGDVVLSPFAGIGSEGYVALEMGRKFVGVELKPSYFRQACMNLAAAGAQLGLAI